MSGLFPNTSQILRNSSRINSRMKDKLYLELYFKLHPGERDLDYYIIQGKKAYEKASRIYKGLNDIKSSLLKKLGQHFEAYACLMQTIQDYLLSPSLNQG
jgi:hypothetical protein